MGMFDIKIAHILGMTNTATDALSRLACHALAVTVDSKVDYIADHVLGPKLFDAHGIPHEPQHFHHGRIWDCDRIVVHRRRVRQVIAEAHANLTSGHLGRRRTYDVLTRKYDVAHPKNIVTDVPARHD